MGMFERARSSRKVLERSSTRTTRKVFRSHRFLLLVSFVFILTVPLLQWFLSFPPPLFNVKPSSSSSTCSDGQFNGYVVNKHSVCTDSCGKICFPRVHGMCVSRKQVTICEDQQPLSQEIVDAGGGLPDVLRLITHVPRARVPVKRGNCPGWDSRSHKPYTSPGDEGQKEQAKWFRGVHMVADVKLMPNGPNVGPNPHHEAEKLIPAILLSHLYGLENSTLHWFTSTDPSTISEWSLGLIKVFQQTLRVNFLSVPNDHEPQVCFEDAILFSGLTNAGYIPNVGANNWLRKRVLGYCNIPVLDASRPVKNVVALKRINSSRSIANMGEVLTVLERELMVVPKVMTSGSGHLCEQVKAVANADVVITPHGSHNINFLFARPYAIVLEAFPLLYYINWFGNYLHAANIHHYELHGTWPANKGGMPSRMRMYSLLYGWKRCFFVRKCMNYTKGQNVFIDIDDLEGLLEYLMTSCRVAVKNSSRCLSNAEQESGSWKNKDKLGYRSNHRVVPKWREQHAWALTQEVFPEKKQGAL
ncbi:hypothetical protein BDL97_11G028500 [Sphagnum fallax]|nr:hypothetical protein BDL97_11G028500 [Sphagnum fallax]KAH8947220.1 hypothetical protein BDL97_11G028500 [Sphagnum fallax]